MNASIQKEGAMILNLHAPHIAQNTWRKTNKINRKKNPNSNLISVAIEDIYKENKVMNYVHKWFRL